MITLAILFAIVCVLPFVLILSGSFTEERQLVQKGLSLLPRVVSFDAYKMLLANRERVINGYVVTIIVTAIGTSFSVLMNSLMAYPISRKQLKFRNYIAFFAFFTMLFNGGMVPWYIICVKYLGLRDSIWALILPYCANAWYMLLLRNYFKSLPDEIFESAKIDGAGEFRIFWVVALPLSIPAIASVTLFIALMYWNDWWLGIMLIERRDLAPLQLMLRSIISNALFASSGQAYGLRDVVRPPAEGVKMAATVVTVGPIIFLYPMLQKYFIKGLLVGAVKA